MELLWQFQSIDISKLLNYYKRQAGRHLLAIGQRAPIFHPEVRSFLPSIVRVAPGSFSVRYLSPPVRLPSPVVVYLILLPFLSWILIQSRKRSRILRASHLEPRRQICRVKSQMNTHSATEGNQRSTGHAGNWQL